MNPIAPLFCTVIEPHKNWVNTAALLMQSLRKNGGIYAESPFVVCVAGITNKLDLIFEDHRFFIFGTNRDPVIPHLNKLAGLRLIDFLPFTHLILLDHDTVILHLNDLDDFLTDEIHAHRNYKYSLAHRLGNGYTKALSIPGMPSWRRVHYFNSGVIFVPRLYCHLLEVQWHLWAEKLIESFHSEVITEEVAFAIALAHTKIPYKFLPALYNQTNWRPPSPDAAIIHYNSSYPINRDVHKRIMSSFEDLRSFLDDTGNRFWRLYASKVKGLLTSGLEDASNCICSIIESSQARS